MIPSSVDIDRHACTRLRSFVELAWPQVEPGRTFLPNWHIDVICEHLDAVATGHLLRLVINIPPGTMKSLLVSVFWPAWVWTMWPEAKWITASYADNIARRDARRARSLMGSPWYQDRWGGLWRPDPYAWTANNYRNTVGGFRLATTICGQVTGEHADFQVIDDPIKPLDAAGAHVDSVKLRQVIEWWSETMATRTVDPATARRVIIMQRLHERDLAGHVLASGDYTHLNLPMTYEPACCISVQHPCSLRTDAKGRTTPPTPLGYKDARAEGDLLWPARFPTTVLVERKKELGSRGVAAQDQQRPTPAGGGLFKRDWVRYWTQFPQRAPQVQSWDMAFKGANDSDHVVGQVWARKGPDFYLLDQVRGRMTFSETCKALIAFSGKWKKARAKLVEDKANGPAVVDLLRSKVSGLLPVTPEGGKISRAQGMQPMWEAGNVYVPDPAHALWVNDFVDELVDFNGDEGRVDDQVDAASQALKYLHDRIPSDVYKRAMAQVDSLLG